MEENNRKGYFAFISYMREDSKWADWLQHKLEHYRLPSNLNGREDLPKAIRPVFKDTTELNPTYLPQQIHEALADSKYLIVICSPHSAKSEWVNKEVKTFLEMGRMDFIIPFIIDGKPHASDPNTECYPQALRDLPANKEILGADINEFGKNAALVKVIAQMLGLKFDTLWQRAEKDKRKRHIIRLALISFLCLLSVCIGVLLFLQNWKIKENHARYMVKEMYTLIDKGESYTAARLALALLPDNILFPNRPYLPEVEAVLREALNRDETSISLDDRHHLAMFSPDGALIAVEGFNLTYIFRSKDGKLLNQLVEDVHEVWGQYPEEDFYGEWVEIKGFSPDGVYIATNFHPCMDSISTSIWNILTGKKVNDIVDLADSVDIMKKDDDNVYHSYNPQRTKVLSSSYSDSEIRLCSTVSGSYVSDFQTNTRFTDQVNFDPSGKYVIGKHGNQFVVWDSKNGKAVKLFSNTWDIFMNTPKPLYITTLNGRAAVCNADDKQVLFTLANNVPPSDIADAYFSKSGKRIIVEAGMGDVFIYDSDTGKEILSLGVPTEGGFYGTISKDDKMYISCGVGASTAFFNLETGDEMFFRQLGYWEDLCISNDNKWLAMIDDFERGVRLYELYGYGTKPLPVPETNSISFSPDSKLLLTCHNDSTVRVWDVKSGLLMSTLKGHHGPVKSATFSPNGREIISSSINGEIKRWQYLPSQELIDKARVRFKDVPLTKEEKRKFFF